MLIKYNNHLTFTNTFNIKNLDSIVSFVYIEHKCLYDILNDTKTPQIICWHSEKTKYHLISFFSNNRIYGILFKIILSPELYNVYLLFVYDNQFNVYINIDKYANFYNFLIRKFVNYDILSRSARLYS